MDEELQRIREKKIQELGKKQQSMDQEIPAQVHSISTSNFQDMLTAHPLLVIDFWAEWCGPCRMVAPVIEALAKEMAGRVTFGKCNTDQNPRIAAGFGISAIPTIILFANGKIADTVVGAYPKEALRARIMKAYRLS
jgi:thioredoxin 1